MDSKSLALQVTFEQDKISNELDVSGQHIIASLLELLKLLVIVAMLYKVFFYFLSCQNGQYVSSLLLLV